MRTTANALRRTEFISQPLVNLCSVASACWVLLLERNAYFIQYLIIGTPKSLKTFARKFTISSTPMKLCQTRALGISPLNLQSFDSSIILFFILGQRISKIFSMVYQNSHLNLIFYENLETFWLQASCLQVQVEALIFFICFQDMFATVSH